MQTNKVLIIGAGLGGLCLAQGLRKIGVDFHVYERDLTNNYRAQGYRIRIHSEGVEALHHCLPDPLWNLFEQTCAEMRLGPMPSADPVTGHVSKGNFIQGGGGPPNMSGPRYTVDRTVLRDVLLLGLEQNVSYGKEVARYETNHIDSVTAFFQDGSAATGCLLVGADGVHSPVRRQRLPDHRPLDTGGRLIYGKTPMTPDFLALFPAGLMARMGGIRDPDAEIPTFTLLEPITFPQAAHRPAYPQLPDDYIYWVMVMQKETLALSGDEVSGLSSEAAAKLTMQLSSDWHESLRPLFTMQDASRTALVRVPCADPEMRAWEAEATVTLIGDAVHVMPPTGASGAVTALRDAAVLTRAIAEMGCGKKSVAAYENEMRDYVRGTIERSVDSGVKSFGQSPREKWTLSRE